MDGKRQKTQYALALEPLDRGEALVGGYQGTEPFAANQHPKARLWRNT
jgi:hypothetical protein